MLQSPQRPTAILTKGSSAAEPSSAVAVRPAWTLANGFLAAARISLLAAVFQAAWYFGGTNSNAVYVSSILLTTAALMAVAAVVSGWRPQRPSAMVWLPGVMLLSYAAFQCISMPAAAIERLAPKLALVQREFGFSPAEQVRSTGNQLHLTEVEWAPAPGLTLIRHETEHAFVTLAMALAIMILASLLFATHSARTSVVWVILVNATALAVWGIIQRARGTTDLLPGFANPTSSIPFSSFIYKNSAAAAIIPGVAAAMCLFYLSRHTYKSKEKQDFSINRYYRNAQRMLSSRELGLLFIACVVAAGIIASLSRGAWIAAGLAVVIGLVVVRKEWLHSRGFLALMALLVVCGGIAGRVASQVEQRIDMISVQSLTDDERVEHWKLGWKTATQYLPLGSGLGTYGYATLLEQTEPTRVWFADAHNQYLELLEELGVFGVVVVVMGMIWSFKRCWDHLQADRSAASRGFGLFALVTLVAAYVQSVGDFVMKLPPNLFQFALVCGMLGVITSGAKAKTFSVKASPHVSSRLKGAIYSLAITGCLLGIGSWTTWRTSITKNSDRALQSASLENLTDGYDGQLVNETIERLSQAITYEPRRASLYRHRAMYYLAQYRQQLIELAAKDNEQLQWENTSPEWLNAVLNTLPDTARQITVQRMTSTPSLRASLANSLADLGQSLELNPVYAQPHATVLGLTPILGLPPKPWSDRFEAMGLSDPEKMYLCGFFAFYRGDLDTAKRNWNHCLQVGTGYTNPIFRISLTKLSAIELAVEVIPPNRPDVLISLVRIILSPTYKAPVNSLADCRKIAIRIAETVLTDAEKYGDRSYLVAASIFALAGSKERAADAWLQAVNQNPRDPQIRYSAADSLRACGRWAEALRNASLGASLSKDRTRFDELIGQIQSQIEDSQP